MRAESLDVDLLLVEWGKWSRGGIGCGVSSVWDIGARRGFAPGISDDMALRVDSAVVACGADRPELRELLQLHYQRGIGLIEIQARLRVGRRAVDKNLAEAKGFVCGYLSLSLRDAA